MAERLGVAAWKARQSPTDKLALLASLRAQGARVAVVGDGVNDAPVLAGADVAIAVGTAADAAQAASDIVITGQLDALAEARAVARADPLDPGPEPALGPLLQPRHRSARRPGFRGAVARGDRHVGELARRRGERVANRTHVAETRSRRDAVAGEALDRRRALA